MHTSMKKGRARLCSSDNVEFMSRKKHGLESLLRALLNKEQHKPVLTMFPYTVAMKSQVGFFPTQLFLTSGSVSNMRILNFHVLFDKNEFNTKN